MNYLRTYRKYLNFNKLFDMFLMLSALVFIIVSFYLVYYYTESYVLLFSITVILYTISLYICKLYEIKLMLPTIVFIAISFVLFIFSIITLDTNYEPMKLSNFVPLSLILIGSISLVFWLYKYETPVSIYLRIKDSVNGMNQGNKIKKIKDDKQIFTTDTLYANSLLFEREKLLRQLNEDYKEEYFKVDNLLKKSIDKQEKEKYKLDDLEKSLSKVNTRLKGKLSGAQDYELNNQKKELTEKIIEQKSVLVEVNDEVTKNSNTLVELKDTFEKESYYISNAYTMRYRSYTDKIQNKLINTRYRLRVLPFEVLTLEEGE